MKRTVKVAAVIAAVAFLIFFFFAPVVYSPIAAWDCIPSNPCKTLLKGYESPSCALLGYGTGIDNRTVWSSYVRAGTIDLEVIQKPWTYYLGCPPAAVPPSRW